MIGTSDQSCWLAEACKILLLLVDPTEDVVSKSSELHTCMEILIST